MGQLSRAWDALVDAIATDTGVPEAREHYDATLRAYAAADLWERLTDVLEAGEPVTMAWVRREVAEWAEP